MSIYSLKNTIYDREYMNKFVPIRIFGSELLEEDSAFIRLPKIKSGMIKIHIVKNGDDGKMYQHGPRIKLYLYGKGNVFVEFPTLVDSTADNSDAIPVDVAHSSAKKLLSGSKNKQEIFDAIGAFACYAHDVIKALHYGKISQDESDNIIEIKSKEFNSLSKTEYDKKVNLGRSARINSW